MLAPDTLHPALPAGLDEALTRPTADGMIAALRALPVCQTGAVAERIFDVAVARLRRDGGFSFKIARHATSLAARADAPEAAARGLKVAGQALFTLGRLRGGLRLLDRALDCYRSLGMEGDAATVQLRRTY